MPAPPTSKQQETIKSPANTRTYGSGTSTQYGGRASTSGTSTSYGGKSTVSAGTRSGTGGGGGGTLSQAQSKGKSGYAPGSGGTIARPGTGGGVRTSPFGLGPSPITTQARLNMLKAADKTGLPGARGSGPIGGTLPGSSARSQLTTAVALGGALADRYGLSPSESVEYVGRIAKTIMGEAANQGDLGQGIVSKSMFNRMNLGAKYGNRGQYTTDPLKMLAAYDAAGLRPGTRVNKVYKDTQPGTDEFASGLLATAKGMSPYGIDPSIPQDFTHYRTTAMGAPYWEKKAQTTKIGDHVFSNPDYSATKVREASPMGATSQPASYAAAPPPTAPNSGMLSGLWGGAKDIWESAKPSYASLADTVNALPGTPDQKAKIVNSYAYDGPLAAAGSYLKAAFGGGGDSGGFRHPDEKNQAPMSPAFERQAQNTTQGQDLTTEQRLQTMLLDSKERALLQQYMDRGMSFEQAMQVLNGESQTASGPPPWSFPQMVTRPYTRTV